MTRRLSAVLFLFFLFFAPLVPRLALADDAACIAASEAEATLQKAVKLREALKQAAICADPSCPAEVKSECAQRIVKMNADMPTVVLGATDENGNDLIGVDVTLDGAPLTSTLDGKAVSIDPGSHVLRFEAAGKPPVEKTLVLREGEKDRHVTVSLGVAPVALPPPSGVSQAGASTWSSRKTYALIAGGVGVAGVAVGAGLGAAALSDWSTAKNECSSASCPASTRPHAQSEHDSAVTLGDVSTVGFVVGVAGIAGGLVLWLTAPHGEAAEKPHPLPLGLQFSPAVGPRVAGMMLGGRFE